MKTFNRVLYAVIADLIEEILDESPDALEEEISQRIYENFDNALQLALSDLAISKQVEYTHIKIDGEDYSREVMIDMLVNGIDYTSDDPRSDARSLIKYLNKTLDTEYLLYPNSAYGCEGDIFIEAGNKIEANISISEGKIFLLQGESATPNVDLFKQIYPEILKWVQGVDQQVDNSPPKPDDSSKTNKIQKIDIKADAIKKARKYMKNRFDYL
jgi:hypothetical protein